jgi:hypothetical protein
VVAWIREYSYSVKRAAGLKTKDVQNWDQLVFNVLSVDKLSHDTHQSIARGES